MENKIRNANLHELRQLKDSIAVSGASRSLRAKYIKQIDKRLHENTIKQKVLVVQSENPELD